MLRHVALIVNLLLPVALVAGDAPAPVTPPATKPVVVNPAPKPFLGVKVDENSTIFDPSQGLPVSAVIPGSTAATMGVQINDLLRSFNGAKLGAEADLAAAIGKTKVGDDVTLELTRPNGAAQEKLTLKGQIAVRPQVASINSDIAKLREEVLTLRKLQDERRAKELSLADMLKMLKDIEDNMPAAVAEFKKQYPKGEFNIQIKIDIVSDKTAKEPLTIGNQPDAKLNPENVNAPVESKDKPKPWIMPTWISHCGKVLSLSALVVIAAPFAILLGLHLFLLAYALRAIVPLPFILVSNGLILLQTGALMYWAGLSGISQVVVLSLTAVVGFGVVMFFRVREEWITGYHGEYPAIASIFSYNAILVAMAFKMKPATKAAVAGLL